MYMRLFIIVYLQYHLHPRIGWNINILVSTICTIRREQALQQAANLLLVVSIVNRYLLPKFPSLEGTYILYGNRNAIGVMKLAVIMKRYRNTKFDAGVHIVCTLRLW